MATISAFQMNSSTSVNRTSMMERMGIPHLESVVQPIGDDPSSDPLSRLDERSW